MIKNLKKEIFRNILEENDSLNFEIKKNIYLRIKDEIFKRIFSKGGDLMLYEFECLKCKKTEEKIMSLKEFEENKNNIFCSCGSKMIYKISSPMFILKGVGWSNMEYGITEREMKRNNDEDKKKENK